jgi:hypothetical protein
LSTLYHETSNTEDILSRIRGIVPTYVDGFEVFGSDDGDKSERIGDDLNQVMITF